jgi:hypothetical protein
MASKTNFCPVRGAATNLQLQVYSRANRRHAHVTEPRWFSGRGRWLPNRYHWGCAATMEQRHCLYSPRGRRRVSVYRECVWDRRYGRYQSLKVQIGRRA